MRLKAARQSPVSAASVPPATTTSASPRWIMRSASPIACAPVAHAEATEKPGPWAPRRMAIVPAAALGIIIGTKCGETARSPPSSQLRHSRLERHQPADAGAHEHAEALGLDAPSPSSPASRAACAAAATASCVKRSARRASLGVIARSGSNAVQAPTAVRDARPLGQQRVEERVGALADRRDDAAAGDDDVGRARPSRSRPGALALAHELLHEADRVADRRDRLEAAVGDLDVVAVLERLDELDEVERVDVEVAPTCCSARRSRRRAP